MAHTQRGHEPGQRRDDEPHPSIPRVQPLLGVPWQEDLIGPTDGLSAVVAGFWDRFFDSVESDVLRKQSSSPTDGRLTWVLESDVDAALGRLLACLVDPVTSPTLTCAAHGVLAVAARIRADLDPDDRGDELTIAAAMHAILTIERPLALPTSEDALAQGTRLALDVAAISAQLDGEPHVEGGRRAELDLESHEALAVAVQAANVLLPLRHDHADACLCVARLSLLRAQPGPDQPSHLTNLIEAARYLVARRLPDHWTAQGIHLLVAGLAAEAHRVRSDTGLLRAADALEPVVASLPDELAADGHDSIATLLGVGFDLGGQDAVVLRRALDHSQRAVELHRGEPGAALARSNLIALALRSWLLQPAVDALVETIDQARRAVDEAGTRLERVLALDHLGCLLRNRFDLRFDLQDADEAREALDRALDLLEGSEAGAGAHGAGPVEVRSLDEFRGSVLVNRLAIAGARTFVDQTREACEAARELADQALDLVSPDHPLHYKVRQNCAAILGRYHEVVGDLDAAEKAYRLLRDLHDEPPLTDPRSRGVVAYSLCNVARSLSTALTDTVEHGRREKDGEVGPADDSAEHVEARATGLLGEAVDAGLTAVELLVPPDPEWFAAAYNLALARLVRHDRSTEPDDPSSRDAVVATRDLRSIATAEVSPILIRLKAAFLLSAVGQVDSGTEGPRKDEILVDVLQQIPITGIDSRSREGLLEDWGSDSVREAAESPVRRHDWTGAIAALERGRMRTWSNRARTLGALERLAQLPELSPVVAEIGQALAALDHSSAPQQASGGSNAAERDAGFAAATRLRSLVREHPASDADQIDVPELVASLGAETVFYPIILEDSSMLLVSVPEGVEPFGLSSLTLEAVSDQAACHLAKLRALSEAIERSQREPGKESNRRLDRTHEEFIQHLFRLLAWLWDEVIGPVHSVMLESPFLSPEVRVRNERLLDAVVWCPSGPLTLLPLHAAGHYDDTGPKSGENLLERTVSSYTASLDVLVANGLDHFELDRHRQLLVSAWPQERRRGEHIRLPSRLVEGDRSRAHLTTLEREAAAVAAVSQAIEHHQMAHFACHGYQCLDGPGDAHLLLDDGILSLGQVAGGRGRDLAYLAACSTALNRPNLLDEALSVVGGFQHNGWRRVVGTLWPIHDDLSDDFYDRLYAQGTEPVSSAKALNQAVLAAARERPKEPDVWAAMVHFGPTDRGSAI